LVDRARRYDSAAYLFVRQALDFALGRLKKRRHITGQELLRAIAEYAKKRFGPLTRLVFEEWGVRETLDFGHIVFEMVDRGIMTKRPEDTIEDFRNGYDFFEEFNRHFDYLSELRGTDALPCDPTSADKPSPDADPTMPNV